jgi:hypothetical protein
MRATPDQGEQPLPHELELLVPGARPFAGVRLGEARYLMHDRVRPGRGPRHAHGRRIQPVHHDALCAQLRQQTQLGRARRRRRHLVAQGQSWGTSRRSKTPVPPATNTRTTITFPIPESVSKT